MNWRGLFYNYSPKYTMNKDFDYSESIAIREAPIIVDFHGSGNPRNKITKEIQNFYIICLCQVWNQEPKNFPRTTNIDKHAWTYFHSIFRCFTNWAKTT